MTSATNTPSGDEALSQFDAITAGWFARTFDAPTDAQSQAWPAIGAAEHTLLLAPTGSGKTLASFLVAIDRLMFTSTDAATPGVRVLYLSPLKALGVDVERNLRAPLAGVQAAADEAGARYRTPSIGIRTGDTPSRERAAMMSKPPDILITTPESLFLLLTSQASKILETVDTVIIDEIHSMVATKRGAHLFVSLERLEDLRRSAGARRPAQRIGLSATQRPLEEVARLLGGASVSATGPVPRAVHIVNAGSRKPLELVVDVPVEDMMRPGGDDDASASEQKKSKSRGPTLPSIWPSIHPRLVELIRAHRSTMIFVNSRRLAERLAGAINDLAEEELAAAHHGSIARETRAITEDRLKRGDLPAIVATSSLELGIDMGAVDLVVQIEAPPSIASGLQRVGRAGHQVGGTSRGVIIPKYRGDLLACAAVTARMRAGLVEESFYPRNPLDVLAQQIVAAVAMDDQEVDSLFDLMRSAAPFADLPRSAFESVLDLLAGRYPSDEFAELRPRVTWDRVAGTLTARKGAQRIAIANAGTIPDRGLYGVFLADGEGGTTRVGELDEEMVFETQPGDVFLLGASSWQAVEITHDRVLVVPAPGQPGRMPFWRGDGPGRPMEFGRAIGELTRQLADMPAGDAIALLQNEHSLDASAARNLVAYINEQRASAGDLPSDRTILIESFTDEVGDWRVCLLSPFGARVHAPWATAVAGRLRAEIAGDVDMVWSDDGIVFRLPESDLPPPAQMLFPSSEEIESLLVKELGTTALFAARFRENAGRSLLLPKRMPGKRTPLWLQRRKSADLLAVAARYSNFPVILETYRECLRDVFDLPGLRSVLEDVENRSIRIHQIETNSPSPFTASLMFSYVGNFIYDADAPLAERRAQTLALDHAQLRELLGDAELRELLDPDVVDATGLELQRLGGHLPARDADEVHDILIRLGDLAQDELVERCAGDVDDVSRWVSTLIDARRIIEVPIGRNSRFIAAEDAGRFRDAFGVSLPSGLPDVFTEAVDDALVDIVSRYARTHVPFLADDVAARYAIGVAPVNDALGRLLHDGRVIEGEFLPGGRGREWCDAGVMKTIKRRSMARLRKEVEPVAADALARFAPRWHGLDRPRRGLDALLDVVEQLQGAALAVSALEQEILPARIDAYTPRDIDELCAAGEIVWRGVDSLGTTDGRIALYLADSVGVLAPESIPAPGELAARIRGLMAERGALFFDELVSALGSFPADVLATLWELVWAGEVTNDTLAPLRSLGAQEKRRPRPRRGRPGSPQRRGFRSRRVMGPPGSEGRWSLLFGPGRPITTATESRTRLAGLLLERHGVLTREAVQTEGNAGGFAGIYPVLKAMEEAAKARRGYFIAGCGASQFAVPGAEDRLREKAGRDAPDAVYVLAATDPANVYGAAVPWPERDESSGRPSRAVGARVIIANGHLLAWIGRAGGSMLTWSVDDPGESHWRRTTLAQALVSAHSGGSLILRKIDGVGVDGARGALIDALADAGFTPSGQGLMYRAGGASAMPRGRLRRSTSLLDDGDTDA